MILLFPVGDTLPEADHPAIGNANYCNKMKHSLHCGSQQLALLLNALRYLKDIRKGEILVQAMEAGIQATA